MHLISSFVLILVLACSAAAQDFDRARGASADTLGNRVLVDPFRWLEMETPERTAWLRQQDAQARAALAGESERTALHERVLALAQANSFSVPQIAGGALFYLELDGRSDERRIRRVDRNGDDRVLAPPTPLDGFRLANFAPSPDARTLILGYENESTNEHHLLLVDAESGAVAARHDGAIASHRPFLASGALLFTRRVAGRDTLYRVDAGAAGTQVAFVARTDDAGLHALAPETGSWVVVEETGSAGTTLHMVDAAGAHPPVDLSAFSDETLLYVGAAAGKLIFHQAPGTERARIVMTPPENPGGWTEVVVSEPGLTIDQAHVFGNRILAFNFYGPTPKLDIYDLDGPLLFSIDIPIGLIWTDHLPGWPGFSGRADERYAYFRSLNLSAPGIYRVDMTTGTIEPFRLRALGIDARDFITTLEWYTSHDGERIPMFVAHVGPLASGAPRRALVMAYGAYGFTPVPFFNAKYLAWMERGGVFAVPYLRGGGGPTAGWHEAGRGANKRNTVADLIAAGQHLVARGYTDASRLAVEGQGPGATVAASAVLQRPELWGAATLESPVTDPVRAQLVRGRASGEYGDATDPATLAAMLEYAPQHVPIRERVPPVLLRTGDRDRVIDPWHSYKLAARLQAAAPSAPVLLRISWSESHGFLRATEARAQDWSDDLTFLEIHLPK